MSDQQDAARYRWLRERPSLIDWDSWVRPIPHYVNVTPALLDGEIDAALAASGNVPEHLTGLTEGSGS